ncbi:MAG: molybdopterin-dependent oxidoreductase [Nitrospira sp.]|nr:molybdopterin-dependent oxidoreductase [Nitrospira sp.]MBH0184793.1 molybdopterin-dependent oxidoreductase [Nitrospira sp.]
MNADHTLERRGFLKGTVGAASLVALSGCDNLTRSSWFPSILRSTEKLTETVQRAVTPRSALAHEYRDADISTIFPANGNTDPGTDTYAEHLMQVFSEWMLEVSGLVDRPRSWSLAALKELPSRTQITRHDCVEGWSAIGKWTGIPLGELMHEVQPMPTAKFAVFHCADVDDEGVSYYESIALADCYHPQTILAYELNSAPLDVPHGAPLRLRFERQLGYKQAKYVMRIELVESLAGIGGGKGGYWEDQGYEWYAGI